MKLLLKKIKYEINEVKDELEFKRKNILTGENNSGKTLLISSILIALGSSYEKAEFLERIKLYKEITRFKVTLNYSFVAAEESFSNIKGSVFVESTVELGQGALYYSLILKNSNGKILKEKTNFLSTAEYSSIIFSFLGIPRKIIWTKSLNSMLMDDLLRFAFISQDDINSLTTFKKILPANRAGVIRITLMGLFLRNPSSELIKLLIDNENLFRIERQKEVLAQLNSISRKYIVSENKDVSFESDSADKIERLNDDIIKIQKNKRPLQKQKRIFKLINEEVDTFGFQAFLDKLLEYNGVPNDVYKWINENNQIIKFHEGDKNKREEQEIDNKLQKLNKDIKEKKDIIAEISKKMERGDKILMLSNFVKKLPKEKNSNDNQQIEKIKNMFEGGHSKFKESFNQWIGKDFDLYSWKKTGGAHNLKKNVERITLVNNSLNKNGIFLPVIIDGILAEDFDEKNSKNPSWVKGVLESKFQTFITLAKGSDNSNKELIEKTWECINDVQDENKLIYNVPDNLFKV